MEQVQYKQTLTPQEWVDKYVKYDNFIKRLGETLQEAINNDSTLEDGRYEGYVFDAVSGSHGIYQGKVILDYFDYNVEEDFKTDEWIHEEYERFAGEVSNILNEELDKRGIHGQVYFGNLEFDNSYGLFYVVDKEFVLNEQ